MDKIYLEFPIQGAAGGATDGLSEPAVAGTEGHLFVRGAFPWPGGTIYLFGQVYAPKTEAELRAWAAAFDPTDPGGWANRCDGDFTAVVRAPVLRRVWVVGDRNGQRRLYFSSEGGTLRAANSLLSVASRMAHPRLSQEGVFHLLALRYGLDPQTLVDGVWATSPGMLFEVGPAGIRETRYHRSVAYDSDYFSSMGACVAGLDAAFRSAFTKRYDPTRRCVVLLSGGIDSVAMLRYLTELAPGKIEAFTFGLKEDEEGDEVRSAQMAARHFGVEHHLFFLDPADMVRNVPACFREADGPHYGSAVYMAVRNAVWDGTWPVDIFSGQDTRLHTPSFDAPKSVGIKLTRAGVRPLNSLWKGALATTKVWPVRGRRTFAYWRHTATPQPSVREYLVRSILNVPAAYAGPRLEALCERLPALPEGAGIQEVFKAVIGFEYLTQFTDDMNALCASMRCQGLGLHFPFYDHDLVAACNRIPYAIGARHLFTTHSWSLIPFTQKAVLRKLLLGSVPEGLVYRRKATLPTIHLAFNAGLRTLVGRAYDRWGSELVEVLDGENASHVRRIIEAVRGVAGPFRFPEEHDLAWDGYTVFYLAVLNQLLSGNGTAVDELERFADEATAAASRGVVL